MINLLSFAVGFVIGHKGWSLTKHAFYWALIALALTYNFFH